MKLDRQEYHRELHRYEMGDGAGSETVRGWSVDNEVAINQKEKYASILGGAGGEAEHKNSKLKLFAFLFCVNWIWPFETGCSCTGYIQERFEHDKSLESFSIINQSEKLLKMIFIQLI